MRVLLSPCTVVCNAGMVHAPYEISARGGWAEPSMAGERRRRRRRMLVCGNVHDNKKKRSRLRPFFPPHAIFQDLKIKSREVAWWQGEKTQREAGVGWMETKKGEACMRFWMKQCVPGSEKKETDRDGEREGERSYLDVVTHRIFFVGAPLVQFNRGRCYNNKRNLSIKLSVGQKKRECCKIAQWKRRGWAQL